MEKDVSETEDDEMIKKLEEELKQAEEQRKLDFAHNVFGTLTPFIVLQEKMKNPDAWELVIKEEWPLVNPLVCEMMCKHEQYASNPSLTYVKVAQAFFEGLWARAFPSALEKCLVESCLS